MNDSSVELPLSFQHMSMAGGIRAAMHRSPDKLAYRHGDRTRNYRDLVDRIDRVSTAIIGDCGLVPGDHGAIVASNSIEYMEVIIGASQAGVALATVNPKLAPAELVAICDDAEARVIFVDSASAEALKDSQFATAERIIVIGQELEEWLSEARPLAEPPATDEWGIFTIPYTSGTTGRPKGVLVPNRSRILSLFAMAAEYGCYSPDDRFLAIAPMCHGAGMIFALAPPFFGGYAEIMDNFEPAAVMQKLGTESITGFFGVPTHFHVMLSQEQAVLDLARKHLLRTVISNAAPLPQAMKEDIVQFFGPGLLHETYGSTEAGIVSNLRPPDQLRKLQCVGQPFPYTLVELRDEEGSEVGSDEVGELFSRSPYLFDGYWQRPEETEAAYHDGWVTVGDMARRDEEGHLYIVDRKKDMVISGGVNIYPREIEEILYAHPDIADVAVVGIPDEKWGERLKAFVVIAGGADLNQQAVIDYCEGRISSMKTPKEVAFIDLLPRNVGGKVLKTDLRKLG